MGRAESFSQSQILSRGGTTQGECRVPGSVPFLCRATGKYCRLRQAETAEELAGDALHAAARAAVWRRPRIVSSPFSRVMSMSFASTPGRSACNTNCFSSSRMSTAGIHSTTELRSRVALLDFNGAAGSATAVCEAANRPFFDAFFLLDDRAGACLVDNLCESCAHQVDTRYRGDLLTAR